jgi:hypothetical protein
MNGLQETTFRTGRLFLEDGDLGDNQTTESRLRSDGRTTQRIARSDLEFLPVPPTTETFQPVSHKLLVDRLEEALNLRTFRIVRSEFAASADGMELFGLLEISSALDGIRFAIGLRNSNDKSMRLGLVAGYRVLICDNMMLQGEFKPMLAKHTKGLDLTESISIGVDRIHRGFEPLYRSIEIKRLTQISDDEARVLIYQAFLEEKFPITLIKDVHQNYFSPPYEAFRERTLWSLENAFTESFKTLAPVRQFETTARLGRFIQPLVADLNPSQILTTGGDGQ